MHQICLRICCTATGRQGSSCTTSSANRTSSVAQFITDRRNQNMNPSANLALSQTHEYWCPCTKFACGSDARQRVDKVHRAQLPVQIEPPQRPKVSPTDANQHLSPSDNLALPPTHEYWCPCTKFACGSDARQRVDKVHRAQLPVQIEPPQ